MYGSSEKRNYFQDLLDDAKNRAVARGSDNVEWNDVWMSAAKNNETSSVLTDRNVSTVRLTSESGRGTCIRWGFHTPVGRCFVNR